MLENEVKELLSKQGVRVPNGLAAGSVQEAVEAASKIPGPWVIKALIPMGKKGKAGLIRKVYDVDEVKKESESLLDHEVNGYTIKSVLLEEQIEISQELYVSFAYDSLTRSPVMLFSPDGGVEIETVAKENPDRLYTIPIDILTGLHPYMVREVCFKAGLSKEQTMAIAPIVTELYNLFQRYDAKLLEINPLALSGSGSPVAVGTLLNIDEEALFRHPELKTKVLYGQERSIGEMTEREKLVMEADQAAPGSGAMRFTEFKDGEIGFGIIGGGSSLTAIDTIIRKGSRPANYCDLGPGKDFERKLSVLYETVLNIPGLKAFICGANIAGAVDVGNMAAITKRILKNSKINPQKLPILIRIAGYNDENIRQEFENWPGVYYYGSEISIEKAAEKVVDLIS
ncbi:MAG: ATP-grasp domain-containing protein [Desulforhopalus sp.]